LEATLRLYRDPAAASERIPTLRMLKADEKQLRRRANRLAAALKKQAGDLADIAVVRSTGRVGGGALPFVELPGPVVALRPRRQSADALARALRTLATPIVARIEDDAVVADPRTILDADEDLFQNGVVQALHEGRDRT
jgi:L-seryl-tRNA(Ser) seleniumtransferase